MLVGKVLDAAQTLRNVVKDTKDSIKEGIQGVQSLFKKGHAIISKVAEFNKSMAEKNKQKQAEKEKANREQHKRDKERNKNKGGTQN